MEGFGVSRVLVICLALSFAACNYERSESNVLDGSLNDSNLMDLGVPLDEGTLSPPDCNCLPDVDVPDLSSLVLDGGFGDSEVRSADAFVEPADFGNQTDQSMEFVDAGLESDTSPQSQSTPSGTCAPETGVSECLFGYTTRILMDNDRLNVVLRARHFEGESLSVAESDCLLLGFFCHGVIRLPSWSLSAAFDVIDQDGVRIYDISELNGDRTYTWYKFYMGDTEVGYLFEGDSPNVVGVVSDGDIYNCAVAPTP